jgi:hypothetical protein
MNFDLSLGAHEQILAMYMPLLKFCETVGGENGWVVKLPFVTNCEAIKFPRTFDGILHRFESFADTSQAPEIFHVKLARFETLLKNYSHRVPYAMVQPRLTNRKENRILVRNGRAEYTVPITVGVRILTYFLYSPLLIIYTTASRVSGRKAHSIWKFS